MQAHEIMTRRPVSGTPQMPLRLAQTVRRRGRFRHLPILEAGRLRGVLSDRDLRRLAAVLEACAAPLLLPPVSGAGADRPRLRLSRRLGTIDPGPVRAALVAARLDVEGPPSDAPAPAGEREPHGD